LVPNSRAGRSLRAVLACDLRGWGRGEVRTSRSLWRHPSAGANDRKSLRRTHMSCWLKLAIVALGAATVSVRTVLRVVRVGGMSMVPTLLEGDLLLTLQVPRIRVVQRLLVPDGTVVVATPPEALGRLVVKRAYWRETETLLLIGDAASRASHPIGLTCPRDSLCGVVLARLESRHPLSSRQAKPHIRIFRARHIIL
jgi:hypothetical protein